MPTKKKYTNGEVTVVWQPDICIHSAVCIHGLPGVFDVKARPWVNISGASSEEIVDQVKKCPSGALSYYMNEADKVDAKTKEKTEIAVLSNGPLLVHGPLSIKGSDGTVSEREKVTAFCRCGASGNKPFCDGTHSKIEFTG